MQTPALIFRYRTHRFSSALSALTGIKPLQVKYPSAAIALHFYSDAAAQEPTDPDAYPHVLHDTGRHVHLIGPLAPAAAECAAAAADSDTAAASGVDIGDAAVADTAAVAAVAVDTATADAAAHMRPDNAKLDPPPSKAPYCAADADPAAAAALCAMVARLDALGWRRVSTRFARTASGGGGGDGGGWRALQWPLVDGHGSLIVKHPWLHGGGADVVRHLCAALRAL
jgi:hypothetical protein